MEDVVSEVIKRALGESRIFKNREALSSDYVPDRLPHREEYIKKIAELLSPVLRVEKPSNIFIYGLTGTGKTAVVKYVIKRFVEHAEKVGIDVFKFSYVNCRNEDTNYRVLFKIGSDVGVRIPFTGLSVAELHNRLREYVDSKRIVVTIVLDEVDFLVKKVGDDLLYRLTRVNDELRRSKVSIVGITNDVKFVETLDPRVKSSLGEVEIVFPPYDALQLADILRERAALAFRDGVLEDGVVGYCASVAAREHGDARRALDLLRFAGEIAERDNASRVTVEHARKAREELELNAAMEVVRTLPYHSKLVLLSLAIGGGFAESTGSLYLVYRRVCEALGLEPLTQRRVSDLVSELDMLGILTSKVVSRGRYGKTREVALGVDSAAILKVLSSDTRIGEYVKLLKNGRNR
ncbi:MAG: orc1/cdc6 family replication initiation protein [Sulfolobales archaeon]|nr:orc1/cdc6 family replication initiation protein [Sulfolobales archaeon]MCX8208755.1 orc1/cdc6 family replication initiation protein [Sulfolobales archaeon]MDW8010333.1 orc1/cdc6 family replication initiation protein [Sulfolobales archaeon]